MDAIMGNIYTKTAAIDFGIQWAGFVAAYLLKTEKFYDLAGSLTFIYLAYQTLKWSGTNFLRQRAQTGMILVWALRLGLYLFTRVLKEGQDRRFNKAKNDPKTFFIFWTMQALWVFISLIPTLILHTKDQDRPITTRDYVGWGMYGFGLLFEVIADYQKSAFRNDPENAGKFIQHGLWSISRHPNYFGEILLWFGMYTSASSVMKGSEFLSVLCPIATSLLITKISGIPLLEKSGMKRWGNDPAYLQYAKNTASLIPFLW